MSPIRTYVHTCTVSNEGMYTETCLHFLSCTLRLSVAGLRVKQPCEEYWGSRLGPLTRFGQSGTLKAPPALLAKCRSKSSSAWLVFPRIKTQISCHEIHLVAVWLCQWVLMILCKLGTKPQDHLKAAHTTSKARINNSLEISHSFNKLVCVAQTTLLTHWATAAVPWNE